MKRNVLKTEDLSGILAQAPKKRNGYCWVMVKIQLRQIRLRFWKLLFYYSIEEKARIIDFYTSDEYSRQLPGMKNVKSVKQLNGKRMKIQKRLLLVNIKELYAEYKKKYSPTSAVCKLSALFLNRLAYVINVGASRHTQTLRLCMFVPSECQTHAERPWIQ